MPYIRIKDVTKKNGKRYTYAYLVKTSWRKRKHPKQKSLKYLGKLYNFNKERTHFHCINHALDKEDLLKDFYRNELLQHGFFQKNNLFTKEDCIIDLERMLFYNKEGKQIVLQLNSGFLCSYSFYKLKDYTSFQDKKNFAKTIALSGIELEPNEFIELYEYMNNV